MTNRRIALVAGAAIVGAAAAALAAATPEAPPDAFSRPQDAADRLPANAALATRLDAGSARRVASFRLPDGREHGVYLARTRDGTEVCLLDTDLETGDQGGGCNDASALFWGRPLAVSLAYEGGPARSTIRDVRIVGIATPSVASVAVELSDGEERAVRLTGDRGFAWAMRNADVRRGLEPVAVVARDASGQVVGRQRTGF
jgi:hypothetical protein